MGNGSGWGKTSGRGGKGQTARSGGTINPYFEGGQMPLYRRTPLRGFNNANFKTRYALVNLYAFDGFKAGEEITPDFLIEQGLVDPSDSLIKILGTGEVKKAFKVKAHAFSKSAAEKIKAAGGEAIVLGSVLAEGCKDS
jgi:large subunit ribosomal protein L15